VLELVISKGNILLASGRCSFAVPSVWSGTFLLRLLSDNSVVVGTVCAGGIDVFNRISVVPTDRNGFDIGVTVSFD
jgi:hypothetical protein